MAEEETKDISNVIDYLRCIDEIEDRVSDGESIIVFRGEPVDYPTFGMPGIFRGDYLKNDPFFERNLLEELKANKLTNGNTYLEIAIDSQHGGFPSRLLDVSYNCLIALYFAVVSVPERKDEEGKKDGRVIVYKVDKAYCPKGKNVIENYDTILNSPNGLLNSEVFSINHKLIDHIKLNNRIVAQQGALISFQGMEWEPIPEYMCETIRIPSEYKEDIAQQLEKYFGISTSFVYPEIEHAVEKYKSRATTVESKEYSIQNEIEMSASNMKTIIDFGLKKLVDIDDKDEQFKIIEGLEDKILSYRQGVENFIDETKKKISGKDDEEDKCLNGYIDLIKKAYKEVTDFYITNPYIYYLDNEIEPCNDFLCKTLEGDTKK